MYGTGNGASVNASDKVVIGNTAVSLIGGYAPGGWSILSDAQFKKDIKEDVPGLEFINKLKPVTYHLEARKFERFLGRPDSILNKMKALMIELKPASRICCGRCLKTAQSIGYDFDGIHHPKMIKTIIHLHMMYLLCRS